MSGRGADARRRAASPPGEAAPARPRGRNKPSFVLSLPSETAYLGLVRELTKKMAETAGFAEPVAERLSLAVDEAATNVIEHAYKGAPDREVELRFEDRGPDFRVELVDTGQMVDPRAVPQVDIDKFVTERRTGGLGMHLMERIMDSVTFRRSARRNVCALVKHKDKDGEAPLAPLMEVPVVFQYQRALDEFRRAGEASPLLKRMSELISLLDLTTTLNSAMSRDEILDAALLIVMGELQAGRGCLLVRAADGAFETRAARGLPASAPSRVTVDMQADAVAVRDGGAAEAAMAALGLEVLCPIVRFHDGQGPEASGGPAARVIAVLGLGPRAEGRAYGREEVSFLRSVAACAATPIENGMINHELKTVNQRLSVKVYQLHTLFDISRELTSSFDEEGIKNLVTSTLMGHLLVSRCALYLGVPGGGLAIAHERGLRSDAGEAIVPEAGARPVLEALTRPLAVAELPAGAIRDRLQRARMALAVPVTVGARTDGFLAVGERVGGGGFTDEDRDFALTLARQAGAALETVRLHRVDLQKQRRDREMQIAREIQRSLFPKDRPAIAGFEVAAESLPCYEVGGDHYDMIPLGDERWALAIADVSGKGAPASILMASVHASLRALAGSTGPEQLMARLNRFLFESTQDNKYVTLFYAELDAARRRLAYVNAGHVPPFWLGGERRRERLGTGGPVLGLLEHAGYDSAEIELAPGELVAMVTDGATEAASPDDEEFGEDRLSDLLDASAGGSADSVLRAVSAGVRAWTGPAGCSDDLTLLVLKAN